MSKRSVDKRDRDKKTEGHPNAGAEPQDMKPVQKANTGRTEIWQNTDLYWYVGLALTALISFYLRAIVPMSKVFVGDRVIFSSETDAWYHMMLAKGTVINLQRLWFDPMTNFPNGTPLHFGPFLSWAIAILSYIFGLGSPSMHTVEVVGAFMPAILGALVVIPVYFIGREIGGKSCGLLSAFIAAVLPGQYFSRTTLGFTDHHAAEILLSTLTMMFLLLALGSGREMTFAALQKNWSAFKRPLLFAALAGVSLGLYIDAWASGFLIEGIILLFIVIQSIVDHMRDRNAEYLGVAGAITFFVAILLVLPFVKPYNGFSNYYYSLFQPTILLLGVAAALLLAFLSSFLREKGYSNYYYPGAVAGILVLGTLILALVIPQFMGVLFNGMSIFQSKTGGAATVGEAAPLFSDGGLFSVGHVLVWFPGIMALTAPPFIALLFTTFTISLIGLLVLILRYTKRLSPTDMLVIIWSAIMLVLAITQNRFTYYYAINVALLTGFLIVWALQRFGFTDLDLRSTEGKDSNDDNRLTSYLKIATAAILILVLVIWPSYSMSVAFANGTDGPDSNWISSTAWLENNTPSPGMDLYEIYERPPDGQKYAYPDDAYGIISWWDFGHLIETIGHRIPNANPFQQGIGNLTSGSPGASPFFLSQSEAEAENVLAGIDQNRSLYKNTRYVMIDRDMATSKFHAMAAWSGLSFSKYASAVYQPQGGQLVPVRLWLEPYYYSMTARMYFFDGSEVEGGEGIGLAYRGVQLEDGSVVPVLTEAPKITKNISELQDFVNDSISEGNIALIAGTSPSDAAFPLEALQHYRLVHESETPWTSGNQVKTFEHVPGAVIKGSASPGTAVTIAVPVMTNMDRAFVYRQSNVTDASGQFTLVVPYSTEGPIVGSTNFDTMPLGPYQLTVGGTNYEVRVPEEYVLSGGVVQV